MKVKNDTQIDTIQKLSKVHEKTHLLLKILTTGTQNKNYKYFFDYNGNESCKGGVKQLGTYNDYPSMWET